MTLLETLQQLMSEIGPATEAVVSVVEGPEGTAWVIEMEDGVAVEAEFNADLERIALTTVLPDPPADRKLETSEALLTFNLLQQREPVVRMAMDKPGGQIVQTTELPTATLDVDQLQAALARFLRVAELWRPAIAGGCREVERAGFFGTMGTHGLRV
jgi:hypothetical protein